MDPTVLAKAHSGVAIFVFIFYFILGGLMLASSAKVRSFILTTIFHFLVLVLVLLGIYNAYLKGYSVTDGFVITKISCLFLFTLLGGMSLKQGLSKTAAIILWLLGLAAIVYAWMVGNHLVPVIF